MIDETTQEVAALHALDLLEGPEREAFARRVATEPELAALVDELRSSAAQLVHTLPAQEPPAHLRANILAAARADGADAQGAVAAEPGKVIPLPAARDSMSNFIPWAIAAALAVMMFVNYDANQRSQQRLAELTDEVVRAKMELNERDTLVNELKGSLASAQQKNDMLNLRIATLTAPPERQGGLASVVWDGAQKQGVLRVDELPRTTGTAVYQLWAISDSSPVPVSAGTFTVSEEGRTVFEFAPVSEVPDLSTFAITLEPEAGRTEPAGPVVLSGKM